MMMKLLSLVLFLLWSSLPSGGDGLQLRRVTHHDAGTTRPPLRGNTGRGNSSQMMDKARAKEAAWRARNKASGTVSAVELIRRLFSNFHKGTLAVRPLVVRINVLLLKVKATIEKEGIFESVIALFIEWHDSRLQWDPNEFGNMTTISLDPEQVGVPDVALTNAADNLYAITGDYRFSVRISSDGSLKYVPAGTARTWCDLKLITFPFDYQQCSLEFESWSLDSSLLTFDGSSQLTLDASFISQAWSMCEWKATTYNHTYFTNETFTRLRFDISVKRKSTFYIINLIFPCATLSMIQMSVFLISSIETTADRIGFGTTNLLTLVVFLTIVTEEMPKTSDAVTALSKYIIALIVLSAVGIFESVAVERLLTTYHFPPPTLLQWLFRRVPVLFRETPVKELCEDCLEDDGTIAAAEQMSSAGALDRRQDLLACRCNYNNNNNNNSNSNSNNRRLSVQGTSGRGMLLPAITVLECEDERLPITSSTDQLHQKSTIDVSNKVFPKSISQVCDRQESDGEGVEGGDDKSKLTVFPSPPRLRRLYSVQPRHHLAQRLSNDNSTRRASLTSASAQQQVTGVPRYAWSSAHLSLAYKARNARLWKGIAYKLDVVTFLVCASLALTIPCMLFLPLIDFQFDESTGRCNFAAPNGAKNDSH